MTALIINAIVCVAGILCTLYGYRRYIRAREGMRKADDAVRYAYRSWPRPDEGPVRYMIRESGTDAIGVYGVYRTDYGDFFHVAIKAFPFASSEKDDIEFAIREAEELIEKLRE